MAVSLASLSQRKLTITAVILASVLAFIVLIYAKSNYNMTEVITRLTDRPSEKCITEDIQVNIPVDSKEAKYRRLISGDADWSELRDTLGSTVNDNCTLLVTPDTEQLLQGQYQNYIKQHIAKLQTVSPGGVEGNTVTHPPQTILYLLLARQKWVVNICEIGFNAGHSAVAWLAGSNNTRLYSFDIAMHAYVRPMAEYVASQFPGRFSIEYGDSQVTVPKFASEKNGQVLCDILVVDGAHTHEAAVADLKNMRALATKNSRNILIFDDFPTYYAPHMQTLGSAWINNRRYGVVGNIFNCVGYMIQNADHGLSLGYYIT